MASGNRTPQVNSHSPVSGSTKKSQTESASPVSTTLPLQQAITNPSSLTPADVLQLQRTIGNASTTALLSRSTQPKPAGPAGRPVAPPPLPGQPLQPTNEKDESAPVYRVEQDSHTPPRQPHRPQISPAALALAIQRRTAYVGQPQAPVFAYSQTRRQAHHNRVATLELNTQVDAEDQPNYSGPGANGKTEYTKLTQPDGVIKEDFLRANQKTRAGMWDVASTGSEALGAVTSVFDLRAGSLDRGSGLREKDEHGYLVDKQGNTTTQDWQEKHSAEVASGSFETVGNILTIANTLRNWKKRNKEERFSDVVDVTKAVASTGAAVTKTVDSGAKMNVNQAGGIGSQVTVEGGGRSSVTEEGGSFQTTASDLAGKVTGNIADFIGVIADVKDLFFKGKTLFETWKKHREDGTKSKGDVVRAGVDLGITVVSAIKDVVMSARNLLFTLENAWHAGLAAAVPGLGIAIGALRILVSIWQVVKANTQRAKMRKLKQEWKETMRDTGAFDAFEEIDNKKIAARKKSVQNNLAKATDPSGKANLQKKLAMIEEYELQKELQTVNRKRIDRQVIHISSALLSIGGDIATLSGVGAHAGVALKAASAATELGAKGLRAAKQFGNDRASKEDAWKLTKTVFNADKSSKAKLAQREKFANMIYDKIIDLAGRASTFPGGQVPDDDPEFKLIRMYIRAVGLSWKAWQNQTVTDPSEGHMAIVAGLAERE